MDIKSFNLNQELINYLEDKKISNFLPVQDKVIPLLLKDKSVFVESPTGTGKTLTFLLPIINNLDFDSQETQAIIITPTRELAIQISSVIKDIKKFTNEFTSSLLIGGEDFEDQIRKLTNGSQIVVGTAERINKVRKAMPNPFTNVKTLVIDEIDMVFNFGSFEEIEEIFSVVPKTITLALFSASFPVEMQNYIKKFFSKEAKNVVIESKVEQDIVSYLIKAYDDNKMHTLLRLINSDQFNPYFCLIFAKTNEEVDEIYSELKKNDIQGVKYFNNKLAQRERARLIKAINNSEVEYLVTTDLMARGMDFPGVTHIVNFSLPADLTYYKHRVGRTNRNSVKGNIYDIYIENETQKYDEAKRKNPFVKFEKLKI